MAQVDEKCLEKRLPENIIIYRDGVGAGDIQTVLDVELKGIKVKNRKKKRFHFFKSWNNNEKLNYRTLVEKLDRK